MDSLDAPMLRWPVQLEAMEREQYDPWEDEKQRKREILDQMAETENNGLPILLMIGFGLIAWIVGAFLIAGLWLLADPLASLIARML